MSDFLLNAGRQTLLLELQEASRLPERLVSGVFILRCELIRRCASRQPQTELVQAGDGDGRCWPQQNTRHVPGQGDGGQRSRFAKTGRGPV